MKKKWYRSRTIWLSIVAMVVSITSEATGYSIPVEIQVGVLAILGIILRFDTDEGVEV
jgi:hypothetical protein